MPSHVSLIVPDKDDTAPIGVQSTPLRVDPTGTTVQPVSFSGGISISAITSGTSIGISGQPIAVSGSALTTTIASQPIGVSGSALTTSIAAAQTIGISGQPIGVSGSAITATIASQPIGVSGTVTVTSGTATNLLGKMDVVGNAGATLDAVITAGTAPANGLAVLAVQNTTAPSLTTGQSVALQCDYEGSLFVKPIRRSQTVAKATTIAVTTATAIVAAPAAGIFADLSTLVISAIPTTAAVSASVISCTVSDGTNSFIFDMDAANVDSDNQFVINFNPPLPATTAATAWTQANSISTVTTHTTTVAILQKAG